MISEEYLAGLFDGDGYVGVVYSRGINSYQLRLTITNSNLLLLQLIQTQYGGKINSKIKKVKPNHAKQWQIGWNGEDAKHMAKVFIPYAFIKLDQLRLAISFPIGDKIGKGFKPKKADKPKQEKIYKNLKTMKRT